MEINGRTHGQHVRRRGQRASGAEHLRHTAPFPAPVNIDA
jgi:hypothetical protein